MADIWFDVDAALSEVPVNLMPLVDDTDFKSIEAAVAYNATGLALFWNFVTTAGAFTCTAVTPTDTGGNYDWVDQGTSGMYTIEIPASGGASINNDTEGFGWFTGVATGILPWRGPVCGFRAAALNNSLIDGTTIDVNVTAMAAGTVTATAIATGAIDADAIADNAIDAGAIAADAITAAKIADGAIDAATFAAGAINAAAIADGAIDLATFAADAKALMGVIAFGTAQAVTSTTIRLAAAEAFADDEIIGATVLIRSASTGAGQARVVTNYTSSTDTCDVDAWTTTPTGTVTYVVFATAPSSAASPITANVTQWAGAAVATPTQAGVPEVDITYIGGAALSTTTAQLGVNVVQAAGTAWASGAITAAAIADGAIDAATFAAGAINAAAIAADAIDADAIKTDAITEIQNGLATATALATVDTVVDAIKVQTDKLAFTVANQVDANIQYVNDVAVTGTGAAGSEWGP